MTPFETIAHERGECIVVNKMENPLDRNLSSGASLQVVESAKLLVLL